MLDPKIFWVSLPPFPLCFFPKQKVKLKKKESSGGYGSGKEEKEQKIANLWFNETL